MELTRLLCELLSGPLTLLFSVAELAEEPPDFDARSSTLSSVSAVQLAVLVSKSAPKSKETSLSLSLPFDISNASDARAGARADPDPAGSDPMLPKPSVLSEPEASYKRKSET